MKFLVAASMIFAVFSANSFCRIKNLEGDSLLYRLQNNLPEGWLIRITDDTLVIENLTPLWVLSSNFINAPMSDYEDSDENKNRIIEHGVKTHAQFSFYLKERTFEPVVKKSKKKKKLVDPNAPNYLSEKHSLYQTKAIGFDDAYTRCYPWNIADEAAKIYYTIIGAILQQVVGPIYPEVNHGY